MTARKLAIPDIRSDPKSMENAVKAIKENVELLTRQRGQSGSWAVTFSDLVALGLVTQVEVDAHLTSSRSG